MHRCFHRRQLHQRLEHSILVEGDDLEHFAARLEDLMNVIQGDGHARIEHCHDEDGIGSLLAVGSNATDHTALHRSSGSTSSAACDAARSRHGGRRVNLLAIGELHNDRFVSFDHEVTPLGRLHVHKLHGLLHRLQLQECLIGVGKKEDARERDARQGGEETHDVALARVRRQTAQVQYLRRRMLLLLCAGNIGCTSSSATRRRTEADSGARP